MARKKKPLDKAERPEDQEIAPEMTAEVEATNVENDKPRPDTPEDDETPSPVDESVTDEPNADTAETGAASEDDIPPESTQDQPEPEQVDPEDALPPETVDTATEVETDVADEKAAAQADTDETPQPTSEEALTTPIPNSESVVPTEQVVVRKGGFFPTLLGGLVAGGIGFGAAQYGLFQTQDDDTRPDPLAEVSAQINQQGDQINAVAAQVEALGDGPDLSGIEAAQSELAATLAQIADRLEGTEAQLSGLDERLLEMEKRPIAETASDAAVAAYERELQALQDAMAAQREEIEKMTAQAAAKEDNAEAIAQATMRRAAMTRIRTALDNGVPFAPALADLQAAGAEAPGPLAQVAQDGVPSLSALQESFPDAARAALAAARKVGGDTESGGFGGFLRTQLGVRSLTPKEGSDPDAILSRVQAAVSDGRLNDALAEIEGLPEEGRAELTDWSGQVARRLEAVRAAETLGETLN